MPHPSILIISLLLVACSDDGSFTLYRTSVLDANLRIHVATFDSSDGSANNHENCELAQSLFQAQKGISTKFWCEKGRFRR